MKRPAAWALALAIGLIAAACAAEDVPTASGPYADLTAPSLVASSEAGDVEAGWAELLAMAADIEQLGEGAGMIPGFEPFNDPHFALTDGRFLVRGRSSADQPLAGWYQQNPASVPPGEENPTVDTTARPVRLFVYDPVSAELLPVSHVPEVRPYATATSQGEGADVVLDVVVLQGERAVAYTVGFSGAAYEVAYEVYVAPIPES